jgi:hypothetical protein
VVRLEETETVAHDPVFAEHREETPEENDRQGSSTIGNDRQIISRSLLIIGDRFPPGA